MTVKTPKLPKAQATLFGDIAKTAVAGILQPILEFRGVEITQEQLDEVMDVIDLGPLTHAMATEYTSRVDFKDIQKVDKFMRSAEFAAVSAATTEVNAAVQSLLIEVVAPLIPLTDEERETKAAMLADEAS